MVLDVRCSVGAALWPDFSSAEESSCLHGELLQGSHFKDHRKPNVPLGRSVSRGQTDFKIDVPSESVVATMLISPSRAAQDFSPFQPANSVAISSNSTTGDVPSSELPTRAVALNR